MSKEKIAVVCLSGGLDSATVLALALQECRGGVVVAQFQYGSIHNSIEARAAEGLFQHYTSYETVPIKSVQIQLPRIFSGGGSALMSETKMPNLSYEEIAEGIGPSPTVVPFRNANLISVATTLAITHNAERVYIGVHAEDARGWAYPDCSSEFIGAMANAVYIGSYMKVRLIAPFQWAMKADIVSKGYKLHVPYGLTWSCYDPVKKGIQTLSCGKCPTCIERINAFKVNNLIDPILYAIDIDWECCKPYDTTQAT